MSKNAYSNSGVNRSTYLQELEINQTFKILGRVLKASQSPILS
jgi:hypothetical protein